MHGIEGFALPTEETDEFGDFRRKDRSGCDDCRTLSFAARNVACRTAAEQIIQLRLIHRQQLRRGISHEVLRANGGQTFGDYLDLEYAPVEVSPTMLSLENFVNGLKVLIVPDVQQN